jgi:hypothetical protein
MMEESPDHAARRIANEWAGVKGIPEFLMVQSHLRPSRQRSQQKWRTGFNHWDICFIYGLTTKTNPKPKPWWADSRFFSRSEMRRIRFGRGHKDILKTVGYL